MEPIISLLSQSVNAFLSIDHFFYTILCGISLCVLVHFAYSPFKYWKLRGVPQVRVQHPFIGNFWEGFINPPHAISQKVYNEFSIERYVGTYTFRTPVLLLRDPELIEAVLIKDFSHFANRSNTDDPNQGKLSKHLLNLGGEHWKTMRNHLTPTFSSGKLKGMHSQLIECAFTLMNMMKEFEDGRSFEVRDVVSRLTMDVIASCAFGLNINTINDPESAFRKMGLAIFKPSTRSKIMFMLRSLPLPMKGVIRKLVQSNATDFTDFFVNVVNDTLEHREKNNIVRPDFLHLMNEIRKKEQERISNKELDPKDPFLFDDSSIVSNAFVFFLAGFETTATTMSYTMYELAMNQDVQERLHNEVSTVLKKHEGVASYNAVQEMVYLEQVLSETLRKYPPATLVGRKVSREYRLPGTDLILPEETRVAVPIYALHHDPQYFPEPEKFVPERFDDGKNAVRKGTYLPFGEGPRICIGARFAKLEAKVALAMMLDKYKIIQCDKTKSPLTFNRKAFLLVPEGGIWVAIQPRCKS